mmetsp:Transcript_14173/g.42699  ORF Transcript_14173/g.42699 Transcript_14173/m.42699 type:complete len:783 (+) Transcript_14173:845-3193(+)
MYATLAAMIAARAPEFADRLCELLSQQLVSALERLGRPTVTSASAGISEKQPALSRSRALLRFAAELMNVDLVSPQALLSLFDQLLHDEEEADRRNRKDVPRTAIGDNLHQRQVVLTFLVGGVLPFAARELADRLPDDLHRVCARVCTHLRQSALPGADHKPSRSSLSSSSSSSSTSNEPIHPLAVFPTDPHRSRQLVLLLADALEEAAQRRWACEAVPRPHAFFSSQLSQSRARGSLRVPRLGEPLGDDFFAPLGCDMRLFSNIESSIGIELDRLIVKWHCQDVLDNVRSTHKAAAQLLLNMPGLQERYSHLNLVVESMLEESLRLPNTRQSALAYSDIAIDLCKMLPARFPSALSRGVNELYHALGHMDPECADRLAAWFAHHLSNFEFQWGWMAWAPALTDRALLPQRRWIQQSLERIVRLSYRQRIERTLPEPFRPLLPAEPTPRLDLMFEDADAPVAQAGLPGGSAGSVPQPLKASAPLRQLAAQVVELFRAKKGSAEVLELLRASSLHRADVIRVLMHCVLRLGARSLTHLLTSLERYGAALSEMLRDRVDRINALDAVAEFWANSHQRQVIVIDRLLNALVLDSSSVISWLFTEPQLQQFTLEWPWAILRSIIRKQVTRSEHLHSQLHKNVVEAQGTTQSKDTEKALRSGIDAALRQQKELFLVIFQRLTMALADRLLRGASRDDSETGRGTDDAADVAQQSMDVEEGELEEGEMQESPAFVVDDWLRRTLGYMLELGRKYQKELRPLIHTMETILFTDEVDPVIMQVYKSFSRC